jgi:hypothetical protein
MKTKFDNRVEILGQFYMRFKDDPLEMSEFIEFNDIGLPLAYLAAEGLCEVSDQGAKYIHETFDLLLEEFGVKDEGFGDFDEILFRVKSEE